MLWDTFFNSGFTRPLRGLSHFHDELTRTLGGAEGARPVPPMDVHRNDEGLLVSFAVPGVAPDELELTLERNVLTLRGRARSGQVENARARRIERAPADFERSMRIPYDVATDEVEAEHRNGILQVRLPRSVAERAVQVPISPSPRSEDR